RERSRAEWLETLAAHDVPCAPVQTLQEFVEQPAVARLAMVRQYAHPEVGPLRLMGQPLGFSATPVVDPGPPPTLGQHTDGIPAVRVEVLAARPHARWGELHGLYEAPRGARPKITLWMRTAKQRRVVAFRTFLRTLLHEVGHHVDYTLLNLPDSFHTEGFYKRESSLFHQLVPPEGDTMPTVEDIAKLPIEQQLARLGRTAHDLAEATRGHAGASPAR